MQTNGINIIFETQGETKAKEFDLGTFKLIQGTHLIPNQNTIKETQGIVIDAPKSTNILPGDKIHFHFNTIDAEHRLDPVKHIYFCDIENIFYTERNGEIIMVNNYILVEKMKQQEDDKVLASGIIVPNVVKNKEYNIGFVRYSNNDLVKSGDKIVYNRHIRDGLTLDVNGEDLLRFKNDRVCAIYKDDVLVPVNGYVLTEIVDKKQGLIIYEKEDKNTEAIVVSTGDKVIYPKANHTEIYNQFLVKEEDILIKM